jgi:hypothetical protein
MKSSSDIIKGLELFDLVRDSHLPMKFIVSRQQISSKKGAKRKNRKKQTTRKTKT